MSVAARLDRLPLSRFHWNLTALAGATWAFNSFNVQMLSFVLAVLIPRWHLSSAEAGIIGSVQVMGMAIGSVAIGALSDRFGRKVALETTVLTFGLATGLAALIDNYYAFTALRFVAGLGLGGMTPVIMTFISEFSPSRRRGSLVLVMDMFWSIGLFSSAAVAYVLMPSFGWQAAFAVGALPVLYEVVLRLALPESPRFLHDKGRHAEAEKILSRIEGGYVGDLPPLAPASPIARAPMARATLGELWSRTFRRRTASLWTMNFCLVFTYYGIFTWLPALLVAAGHPMERTFELLFAMGVVQIPGKLIAAFLVESIGRKWTIAPFSVLYGICALFLGLASGVSGIFFWGCAMSFVNSIVFGTVLAYTPESYPTRARSTGSGAAFAISRVGGFLGPMFVGLLLAATQGNQGLIFAGFAVAMAIGGITVALLGEETKGRSLEDIAR